MSLPSSGVARPPCCAPAAHDTHCMHTHARLLLSPTPPPHHHRHHRAQLGLDYAPLAQYLKDGDFRKVRAGSTWFDPLSTVAFHHAHPTRTRPFTRSLPLARSLTHARARAPQPPAQADDETRALLIKMAGPGAVARGWVYFTEVKTIPKEDLQTVRGLNHYRGGRGRGCRISTGVGMEWCWGSVGGEGEETRQMTRDSLQRRRRTAPPPRSSSESTAALVVAYALAYA
jgi:hypothetical protein